MNILMMTRHNFEALDGGDKIQLLETKKQLEKLGHSVKIASNYQLTIKQYDLVHLFNMQINPHSFLIYLLKAKSQKKPVALSTIYWNPSAWQKHRPASATSHVPAGSKYRFPGVPRMTLLGYFLKSRVLWKWLYLSIRYRDEGKASKFVKQHIIAGVDVILPNGKAEEQAVIKDFCKPKKSAVIPNGVDLEFQKASAEKFYKKYKQRDFVLSVGRLESRKNLLPLVQAAKKHQIPLVLIGSDTVEPDYARQLKAAAGPKFLHIPQMPHHQLGSAYKAAKVHALVSWFETPGLSSLEAAVAGCNIVSTSVGPTKEYFEDMAWYCNPADKTSIEQALVAAFKAQKSQRLSQHVAQKFNWKRVAELTATAYETITTKP